MAAQALLLQRRQWLMLAATVWAGPALAMRHERQTLFGSPADVVVPEDAPDHAVAAVWRGLASMNQRWNAWKPGEVTALNQAFASGQAAQVSPALRGLIEGAAAMERLSLGCFNAGIGGLVGAWGFHADDMRPGTRPSKAALAAWTSARPSLAQIEWQGDWAHTRNAHLQLDFGGYAKGVALDWALARLRAAGVQDALINLGGNLATMGGAGGRDWNVGLRDPHGAGLMARIAPRAQEAVVTSGSYERFRILDGRRCGHLLDPTTGTPAAELVSVTVLHPSAALADAAATALLVAGPARWRMVAARMGVEQVLVVDRGGRQQATPPMALRLLPVV